MLDRASFSALCAARRRKYFFFETKYRKGKAPATAADVKVGDRVVLTLLEKEGKKIAQEVLLAPAESEHA